MDSWQDNLKMAYYACVMLSLVMSVVAYRELRIMIMAKVITNKMVATSHVKYRWARRNDIQMCIALALASAVPVLNVALGVSLVRMLISPSWRL